MESSSEATSADLPSVDLVLYQLRFTSALTTLRFGKFADVVLLRSELQSKICVTCVVYLVFLTSGSTFTDITSC